MGSNPVRCVALKQGAEQRPAAITQLGIGPLKQLKPRLPGQCMQCHQQGGIVQSPAQQWWVQRFDGKIGELCGSDLRRVDDAVRLCEERAMPQVNGGRIRRVQVHWITVKGCDSTVEPGTKGVKRQKRQFA